MFHLVPDKASTLILILFHMCSSLGQNFSTSTYVGEISFAIVIATLGLVLFALLIGNMQVSSTLTYKSNITSFLFKSNNLEPDYLISDYSQYTKDY